MRHCAESVRHIKLTGGWVELATRKDSPAIFHSSCVCTTSTHMHDEHTHSRVGCGDVRVGRGLRVLGGVEFDAQERQTFDGLGPHLWGALAESGGEDQCVEASNASCARASSLSKAARTARISPETPRSPDSLCSTRSPVRVPIISPSSGVNPMVVSMLTPSRMTASEQPLHRRGTACKVIDHTVWLWANALVNQRQPVTHDLTLLASNHWREALTRLRGVFS